MPVTKLNRGGLERRINYLLAERDTTDSARVRDRIGKQIKRAKVRLAYLLLVQ